jgi:hypothetical protein
VDGREEPSHDKLLKSKEIIMPGLVLPCAGASTGYRQNGITELCESG